MPGVHRLQHVHCFRNCGHSLMKSDPAPRCEYVFRTRSRMVTWPLPSILGGRTSSRPRALLQLQFREASSIVTSLVRANEAR